jgi:phosphatidylglycerol lysyltransferase
VVQIICFIKKNLTVDPGDSRLFADVLNVLSFLGKTDFKFPLNKVLAGLGLAKEPSRLNIPQKILEEYGQNSLEYFKLGEDKSFYFSRSSKSFLSYRVFGRSVIVLGDPVGPYEEIEGLVNSFYRVCQEKNKSLCFFQTSSYFAEIYKRLNFHVTAIGNEGLINLPSFNLQEPSRVKLREQMKELDTFRYRVRYYKNTTDKQVLEKLRKVSDEWLSRGQVEKVFALGSFSEEYMKTTTVMTVEDMVGNVVAFINLIPSYKSTDITVDLMRVSKKAPEAALDYLLTHAILFFRELGYQRLSLGLVPVSVPENKLSSEQTIAKTVLAKMDFLFNDIGQNPLKERFITILEPRYFTFSPIAKMTKPSAGQRIGLARK